MAEHLHDNSFYSLSCPHNQLNATLQTSQCRLLFVRRNYVFLGTVFAGAFAFEMTFDSVTDSLWDKINKGRQWKDIRAKYIEAGDEE
ncbi:hypothetical protein VF21_05794 [Pseudogymnoascus sp. 05NY08]|nr:hypothetical protein VF21_05794 [Pseudogymnoascus sp. 05NY08]